MTTTQNLEEGWRSSRKAMLALAAVVGLHLVLLLASVNDYWADNDLGYHLSLSRQYALHGAYWWDHINWAPSGRPNLQGPLLHYAIGLTGRLLGGGGDDYVRAFSLLALLQWAAAMFTAIWFARRIAGDWAALLAAALLSGGIFSAASFFVGVPSGWIFIFTPWAIHFFLKERWGLAILFTTAAAYVHLGGAPAAGFGVLLAGLLTRKWKGLLITGGGALALASPYIIHFLRHLDWYTGQRGHVAGSMNYLVYLLAGAGIVWMLFRPKDHLFPLIWIAAPIAWLYQDSLRFFLQSSIAAAVIAAVFLTAMLGKVSSKRVRTAVVAFTVLLATVFPFSIPSLPVEYAWAVGRGFPRELDWKEARALAEVLEKSKLNSRIVNSYYDSLSLAMAVYTDLRQEFGHWGEVRPKVNPAANISTGEKVYVIPVPPADAELSQLEQRGFLRVHGGSAETSIVTLEPPRSLEETSPVVAELVERNGLWLAKHAENNSMPPPAKLFSQEARAERGLRMLEQRKHAGRIQVAVLLYAYAAEGVDQDSAAGGRRAARGWGSVANFIGDETAIDYLSAARFERFRQNIQALAQLAPSLKESLKPKPEVNEATDRLFREFF